jgi:hypothetical protein
MKVSQMISENTGISIGVLIALSGFIAWLTDLHATAATTADRVVVISQKQEKDEALQQDMRVWMTRVEGKLDQSLKKR